MLENMFLDKEDGLVMLEESLNKYGLSIYNSDGSIKTMREVLDLFSIVFKEVLNNENE